MYAYLIIYEASYLTSFKIFLFRVKLKRTNSYLVSHSYISLLVLVVFSRLSYVHFVFSTAFLFFIYCTFRYTLVALQHYNILFFKIKDFYIFFSIFFQTVCNCPNNNLNLCWCSCCYNNWLAKYNLWLSDCLLLSNWASFFSKSSYTFNTTCHYKG